MRPRRAAGRAGAHLRAAAGPGRGITHPFQPHPIWNWLQRVALRAGSLPRLLLWMHVHKHEAHQMPPARPVRLLRALHCPPRPGRQPPPVPYKRRTEDRPSRLCTASICSSCIFSGTGLVGTPATSVVPAAGGAAGGAGRVGCWPAAGGGGFFVEDGGPARKRQNLPGRVWHSKGARGAGVCEGPSGGRISTGISTPGHSVGHARLTPLPSAAGVPRKPSPRSGDRDAGAWGEEPELQMQGGPMRGRPPPPTPRAAQVQSWQRSKHRPARAALRAGEPGTTLKLGG